MLISHPADVQRRKNAATGPPVTYPLYKPVIVEVRSGRASDRISLDVPCVAGAETSAPDPETGLAAGHPVNGGSVVAGSILLGLGLGGFFDGIVLHQILQWHHMLSEREPADMVDGLELNTVADGVFHIVTYIFTLLGVLLLWHGLGKGYGPFPARMLGGGLLTGWGLFNLVEGIVDHHILEVHHVRHGSNELVWDLGFLAWGAVMLVVGVILLRSAWSRVERR